LTPDVPEPERCPQCGVGTVAREYPQTGGGRIVEYSCGHRATKYSVEDVFRDAYDGLNTVSGALTSFSQSLPPGYQQNLAPIISQINQIESKVSNVESMIREDRSLWGQLKSQAVGAVIGFAIGVVLSIALRYFGN